MMPIAHVSAYYRHRGSLYCLLMARIYDGMCNDAPVSNDRGYHDCVECGDGKRECTCGLDAPVSHSNCPCGGWDCTGAPEGPMYSCPYAEPVYDHGK